MTDWLTRFCALAVFGLTSPAIAQVPDNVVEGDLLTGWRGADGTHTAALRLRLAPGWKTYWRTPGDGGIPPRFDWATSENISSVSMHWPTPQVFWQNGMRSIGYDEALILPLRFRTDDPEAPIVIDGTVEIGVCEEVCVPVMLEIGGVLPADAATRDGRIAAALADRPMTREEAGVRSVSCEIEPIKDGLRLTATLDMPRIGSDENMVVEAGDPTLWVSDGVATRLDSGLTATVEIVPPDMKPFPLERSKLVFTVISGAQAVTVEGCS